MTYINDTSLTFAAAGANCGFDPVTNKPVVGMIIFNLPYL